MSPQDKTPEQKAEVIRMCPPGVCLVRSPHPCLCIAFADALEEKDEKIKQLELKNISLYERNIQVNDGIACERAEKENLREQLHRAQTYTGFEIYACPLCTYENGKFIRHCEMHKEIERLRKKLIQEQARITQTITNPLHEKELSKLREQFAAHTKAVSELLNDLYAIMVNPLAEGKITVTEIAAALLRRAQADRQTMADNQIDLADLRERLIIAEAMKKRAEHEI